MALAVCIASASGIVLCSCSGDSGSGKLDDEIRRIVSDPSLQNERGLEMLTAIILDSPEACGAYILPDGSIDLRKLQQTVSRLGRSIDPAFSWDLSVYGGVPAGDLRLNLFLERSGSMNGYDARSTSGDFKRTLNEIITRFPRVGGTPGKISIVNDAVYPFSGTFEQFVQQKDIFDATAGVGDPSYTDFASIFEYVLRDTVAENINVLVTDMIYSPRDTEGVTPAKIFNEEQSLATSIFQKHADKSVMVVMLQSDFDGMYYPYDSPSSGVRYKGQRPYYAIITGSAAAMHKLRTDSRYASFTDFATLPGYKAHYRFSRYPQAPGYFAVLPFFRGNTGSFTLTGSDGTHTITRLKADKPGGMVTFTVAADMGGIAADKAYMLDMANYNVTTDGIARLLKVEPVTPQMVDARNRRHIGTATHLFTIEADPSNPGKKLELSLADNMPEWFHTASDADDTRRGASFGSTTFGLGSFMEGIYRAFHGTAASPKLVTMTILIE